MPSPDPLSVDGLMVGSGREVAVGASDSTRVLLPVLGEGAPVRTSENSGKRDVRAGRWLLERGLAVREVEG